MSQTQYLQTKLAMDPGLKETWDYITSELKAMDKPGIIRLALSTLAKKLEREQSTLERVPTQQEMIEMIDEMDTRSTGMTEDEYMFWWNNTYKKTLQNAT
jgi:hypothetical protein